MELKAKIIGVESAFEGVVIVIQQEKMKLPIAEDPISDESVFIKKISRSMKMIGFDMHPACQDSGFRTGFWMPMEDYEALGKPSIGEVIILSVKVEK